MTLKSIESQFAAGRPALLAALKEAGVGTLGARQKLTNALAKAKRLGTLQPYLDEEATLSSGLAMGVDAATPLAKATLLKERGNAAFKGSKPAAAVDAYGDAIRAAEESALDSATRAAAMVMLAALHCNTAAAYLKLEEWEAAASAASRALEIDETQSKALYRRGLARSHLADRAGAKRDLAACIRLDPKNRDAREAHAALEAKAKNERAAKGEAVRRGLQEDEEEREMREWREECDRLRAAQGAQASAGGYQMAPISLEAFRSQKAARAQAEDAKAAAAREEAARAAREAARRSGVDLDAIDALREGLRSEGVDVDDLGKLHAALRRKGIDPDDPEEFAECARGYVERACGGGAPTVPRAHVAGAAKPPPLPVPSPAVDAVEDISTDTMYSISSWSGR